MKKPILSRTHQQHLVEMIREQRYEIRALKRELDATQPYLLWMATRIHYLETNGREHSTDDDTGSVRGRSRRA